MLTYKNLLFDLDGTLTDPKEGITKSIAYALEYFDIAVSDLDSLTSWIGPPIKQSLMDIYHFDEKKADLGTAKYRERFADIGIYENILFDGVHELLNKVKNEGHRIYLATSKPTVFAQRILEHFKIDHYFDFVGGSSLDDSRPTKKHVIEHVLKEAQIIDIQQCLMVGDRKYDILSGRDCGLATLGVLYGFGSLQELQDAGADYLVESVEELHKFFSENK